MMMRELGVILILLFSLTNFSQGCGDHLQSTKHCKTVKLVKNGSLTPVSYKKVSGEHCFEHYENDILRLMVMGNFENGQFMDGHEYVFDSVGLLEYILVYKDGKYAGNGISESALLEADTINQLDKDGKKSGYWILTGQMKAMPEYCPQCKVEEGVYERNRKVGLWKKYYANGWLMNKITYVKGKAKGPYETYYENGRLEERGCWNTSTTMSCSFSDYESKSNHHSYERYGYFDSGCISFWTFQTADSIHYQTFNDDCNNTFFGTIASKTSAEIKPTISSLPCYDYWPRPTYEDAKSSSSDPILNEDISSPSKTSACLCKGGQFQEYDKCYNDNKDILIDGEFRDDTLYNGKYYIYDDYGLLDRIAIFEKGQYVGNGIIK